MTATNYRPQPSSVGNRPEQMETLARRSATLAAFLRDAGMPAHAIAAEHIAEALRDLTRARLRRVA